MFQIVFWLLTLCYAASSCTINMATDIPQLPPVIRVLMNHYGRYELFRPTGQVTTFPVGSRLHLSCFGNKNSFINIRRGNEFLTEFYLNCGISNKWIDGNIDYNLAYFGCKSIPSSSIRDTSRLCSRGQGQILQPGFQIANEFYPTFDICYNITTDQTFYTHHKLNGAAISYKMKESTRRPFSAEGMNINTAAANNRHTINSQIIQFEHLFGKGQRYVSKFNFLARGHLTPDADFIMSYEQAGTYYYVNTAPEFQVVNTGNWLRVENQARKLAGQVGRDLSIYNGCFGILALPDSSGNWIQVNLDNAGTVPIPQYFFKVLQDEQTDSAIVFLTYNSPYETSVKELCLNVCKKVGLYNSNYKNYNRGYTYCCTLNDFLQIYNDLPWELSASTVLTSSIA